MTLLFGLLLYINLHIVTVYFEYFLFDFCAVIVKMIDNMIARGTERKIK